MRISREAVRAALALAMGVTGAAAAMRAQSQG